MQHYMFLTLCTIKYIGSSDTRPGHLRHDANPLSSEEPAKELARDDCRATASSSDINDAKKCLDDMKDTWQTGLSENPADTDLNAYYALASFDLGLLETVEPPKDAILPETPQNSLECISSDPALDAFDQANLNIAHKTQTESGMHHSCEQGFITTQNSILGSLLSGNNNAANTNLKDEHEPFASKVGSVGTCKTDECVTDQQMLVAKPTEDAHNSSLLDRSREVRCFLMPESNIEHSTWQQARGLNSQTSAAPLAARRRSGKDLQHKVMCSKRFKGCDSESSARKGLEHINPDDNIDDRSLASNLDAHHHRESVEELYYKRFKAQLIDLHNINEASNAFMSKLIDCRIIFPHNSIRSRLFREDALQFNYLLYVLSSIRYSASYEIVNYIITTYTAKLGVKPFFHTIDTFNAKFMETAANLMPLFRNPDDFIQLMLSQVQQYCDDMNNVISFAEKQALFIKFVEETILDQTGNGKYVLKPHMWKLQMYMPEIGPYFNWRITINGNLSYRGVVSDFDFAKEMNYIRVLLEKYFNDNPSDKDYSASSINQGIVYEYREYIRNLLQSDQYCRSIDYRIYQFAFDLRSNSEQLNIETIRQNLVFMLAFSIQDQESVILNQWTMGDINEIFSLERLDSFFLKNLECRNTNFNVITHEIFFHVAMNIRKNSVGHLTLADEQSFIVCFISGIWIMTYTKEENALYVLRLTRKQMFKYFHAKMYGYYCY